MNKIKSLISDEIINVPGKGDICILDIILDKDLPFEGEILEIDNKLCICKGIEYFKGMIRKPTVGILFKEL